MRKLVQAYTDEAGQIVVDPAIIKAVQDADRIYILAAGTSYHTQDLLLRRCWKNLTDTPVELGNFIWWGYSCHFSTKPALHLYQPVW